MCERFSRVWPLRAAWPTKTRLVFFGAWLARRCVLANLLCCVPKLQGHTSIRSNVDHLAARPLKFGDGKSKYIIYKMEVSSASPDLARLKLSL
jgi:hypothetical protein